MKPVPQKKESSSRRDEQSSSTSRQSRPYPTRRISPNQQQQLIPILEPPVSSRRNNQASSSGMNDFKERLRNQLPSSQGQVREAWRSNPASRAGSRQPSRAGSRHPSGVAKPSNTSSTNVHTRALSYDDYAEDGDREDIKFHEVSAQTLPRSHRIRSHTISERRSTTLPSIGNTQSSNENPSFSSRSRTLSDTFRYGHMEFADALNAIEKAASSLRIRDVERRGYNSVVCQWNDVKIQMFVKKEQGTFKISFSWLSGGNVKSFNEKRDKLAKRIKV